MACDNTIHQNVPSSVPPCCLSTSLDPRVHINWVSSITAIVPLTPYLPATFAEATIPGAKAVPKEIPSRWVLFRSGSHNRRPDRNLDEMVFGWSRPVGMGDLLDPRREDTMESTLAARILGSVGRY
jgi:hypothetical protein